MNGYFKTQRFKKEHVVINDHNCSPEDTEVEE